MGTGLSKFSGVSPAYFVSGRWYTLVNVGTMMIAMFAKRKKHIMVVFHVPYNTEQRESPQSNTILWISGPTRRYNRYS